MELTQKEFIEYKEKVRRAASIKKRLFEEIGKVSKKEIVVDGMVYEETITTKIFGDSVSWKFIAKK